jgi:hypothetical protein
MGSKRPKVSWGELNIALNGLVKRCHPQLSSRHRNEWRVDDRSRGHQRLGSGRGGQPRKGSAPERAFSGSGADQDNLTNSGPSW